MVSRCQRKMVHLTRSQQKQRLLDLETNAAIKRARLVVMKRLAKEFLSTDMNGKFHYDVFYKENKNVYPWLKKELLRWHNRRQREISKKKITIGKSISSLPEEEEATPEACKV